MARDIFVISDLHMGDGGPRDNFGYEGSDRPEQLGRFLDYVAAQDGELIVIGDLLEFWQANVSKVIVHNLPLLDRLAQLQATYVLGNHDADLVHFIGRDLLNHPLLVAVRGPFQRTIGGMTFRFMHGHELDPANAGDTPGIGRVAAILGGIGEDLVGAPTLPDGRPVELVLMGWVSRALGLWRFVLNWFKRKITAGNVPEPKSQLTPRQNPDRHAEMIAKYAADRQSEGYDVAVVGHTHQPGRIGDWYFNTGSWATTDNNFVRIDGNGLVTVFDWRDGQPVPNTTVLEWREANHV